VRVVVFLLILANLLFLAWTHGYFGESSDPDAFRVEQQLLADRIRVVARDEPPAETVKPDKPAPPESSPAAEACLQLADLPLTDSARIESLIAEKWPAFKAQRAAIEGAGYWVFIPPLASKQEADAKAAELKRLRVPEFFVVQEAGANNRAISLGLFSSREAATARLDMLRGLGVKSARVGERNSRSATVLLEIHGPATQADTLTKALAEALPDGRPRACPKPAAQ
jgi:hypothetical protein